MLTNKGNPLLTNSTSDYSSANIHHIFKHLPIQIATLLALITLSLFSSLYLWVIAVVLLLLTWQSQAWLAKAINSNKENQLYHPLQKWLQNVLALSVTALIAVEAIEKGMLASMVNLLFVATTLKFVGATQRKDHNIVLVLNVFLLATGFLFNQSIGYFIVIATLLFCNFILLASINSRALTIKEASSLIMKLVLLGLPIAALLFVGFPRLAPLWKLPNQQHASTGLSDTVEMGSIAELTRSGKLAFRAQFLKQSPLPQDLYWRTMIHERYDGKRWSIAPFRTNQSLINMPAFANEDADYVITYEPSFTKFLPVIDGGYTRHSSILSLPSRTVEHKELVTQKIQYYVKQFDEHPDKFSLTPEEVHANLTLPKFINPKTRELTKELRLQSPDTEQFAQHVMNLFSQKPFAYTLKPPLLVSYGNNQIDGFMFETKAGFCAHYASAFTFMMRLAGIPSRLVTGYLGGEYNQTQNYYSVYQFDAHAWAEIWIRGKGWTRYDPTSMVAPERILNSLQNALPSESSSIASNSFSLINYRQYAFINWLRISMNNVDFYWSRWILSFDAKSQNNLLEMLFNNKGSIARAIFVGIGLTVVLIVGFIFSRFFFANRQQSPVQLWIEDIRKIFPDLLVSQLNITPNQLLAAVELAHPCTKPQVLELKGIINSILYKNVRLTASTQRRVKRLIQVLKRQQKKTEMKK
ncbi:transglutaminase family protein [Flocculibacter collagenilyticus]|uniref:transglutaminase family protein n=1 Tax=Flocculibacter collagenilyticus TaxID=2744479 RepID=UPI0018F6C4DA|nr:transglutaminaseTgpA domain-containing protein [Flocculibacter collagenilyticus]